MPDDFTNMPANDLQTPEEIAAFLKVDPKTVFNWAKVGIIPEAFRVGKTARFSLEAVQASLKMNRPDLGRSKRSVEDIVRLAFTMIDHELFPPPVGCCLRRTWIQGTPITHCAWLTNIEKPSKLRTARR